jgi:hypothetical protein
MRVKDILRAEKSITDGGKWREGKMPASQFPLKKGRRHAFMLRAAFRWRVIRFLALGNSFRAVVAYRSDVDEYRAYIGMEVEGDTRLILEYAYHGSHEPPGWHVHSTCGPVENLPSGVMRSPWLKRLPQGSRVHRRRLLVADGARMTDSLAYHIFAKRARLPPENIDLFEHGALP